MSRIIGDEPCPKCREKGRDKSGNHLIVFEDGGKHCNRCGFNVRIDNKTQKRKKIVVGDIVEFNTQKLRVAKKQG